MDIGYYNSYLEVDLRTVAKNMDIARGHLGKTALMPVVKANAYGTGIGELGKFYTEEQGAGILACAQVCEGVALRNAGVTSDILLMSGLPAGAVSAAAEYDLQAAIFSREGAKALSDAAKLRHKTQKCQIKIETGMNRIGVKPGEPLEELLGYIAALGNLEIVGVFTHFVTAGEGENP
ncbi:MAG: alanine racemase, partial [Oscillospiraceae bacterium]